MTEHLKLILTAQLEAALAMLDECVRACPDRHWEGLIAKYPSWQVAYHTLCFVDLYLSPDDASWRARLGERGLHPRGRRELDDEHPSRRFDQAELIEYIGICRRKLHEAMGAETAESLAGASGFPRLAFSRAELHLYNLRHIQHHTGQLGAFLRKVGVGTAWVKSGWN